MIIRSLTPELPAHAGRPPRLDRSFALALPGGGVFRAVAGTDSYDADRAELDSLIAAWEAEELVVRGLRCGQFAYVYATEKPTGADRCRTLTA